MATVIRESPSVRLVFPVKSILKDIKLGLKPDLIGHSHDVTSVNFSHDSKLIASGSYDTTIKIWNVESSTCLQTF